MIYVLLGVLYELHPPAHHPRRPAFGGSGGAADARVAGLDLTLIATIGILLLIGIVKKNAIMMIDFALDQQRHRAWTRRMRSARPALLPPIMMTTLAALMGAMPIALGLGAGAELPPAARIGGGGGLLFSQAITLYITPVMRPRQRASDDAGDGAAAGGLALRLHMLAAGSATTNGGEGILQRGAVVEKGSRPSAAAHQAAAGPSAPPDRRWGARHRTLPCQCSVSGGAVLSTVRPRSRHCRPRSLPRWLRARAP